MNVVRSVSSSNLSSRNILTRLLPSFILCMFSVISFVKIRSCLVFSWSVWHSSWSRLYSLCRLHCMEVKSLSRQEMTRFVNWRRWFMITLQSSIYARWPLVRSDQNTYCLKKFLTLTDNHNNNDSNECVIRNSNNYGSIYCNSWTCLENRKLLCAEIECLTQKLYMLLSVIIIMIQSFNPILFNSIQFKNFTTRRM